MPEENAPVKKSRLRIAKRIFLGLLTVVLLVLLGVIIFLGDITEYLIEKNDVKYTGREIELADLRVKIFSGVISLDRLQFKEANGTDDFVTIRGIYAEIKPFDLISKQLTVEEVNLDRMVTNISHENRVFNFNDLIERFYLKDTTTTSPDTTVALDWNWDVANIAVDSCRFDYRNLVLDSRIVVDPLNLTIPLISSSVDTVSASTDLAFINGGSIASTLQADLAQGDYIVDLNWDRVPFDYLLKYLKDYLDVTGFGGYLSLDINADGNLTQMTDITVNGTIDAEEMRILDTAGDTVFAFQSIGIEILEADYDDNIYRFGKLNIDQPYIRFELFPEGDNLTSLLKFEMPNDTMATDSIQNISLPGREYFNVFIYLADYAGYIVEQYSSSAYTFDDITLQGGTINYIDHTLNEKAQFLLENIYMHADGFDSDASRVSFDLESDINKIGHFDAEWSFDPHNVLEMELSMQTTDFLVVFASPYSFFFTAHAFIDGNGFYDGNIEIHNRQITSTNTIRIEDIEVGKKGFADPPIRLPVRLAVSILRDVNGDIELEVPVSGDLDDPKFNYWPAVFQVLENNLVKIVTAPYRLFASMFSVDEEDIEKMQWTYGQTTLEKSQEKSMRSLSKVLEGKPDLALTYIPLSNRQREREYLAGFESKRRYYCAEILKSSNCTLTAKDTLEIAGISNKDSLFNLYLREQQPLPPDGELKSVSELTVEFVGASVVDSTVEARAAIRESLFVNTMRSEYGIRPERIIRIPLDSVETPPDTFNLIGPKFILGFDLYEPSDTMDSVIIDQ